MYNGKGRKSEKYLGIDEKLENRKRKKTVPRDYAEVTSKARDGAMKKSFTFLNPLIISTLSSPLHRI